MGMGVGRLVLHVDGVGISREWEGGGSTFGHTKLTCTGSHPELQS